MIQVYLLERLISFPVDSLAFLLHLALRLPRSFSCPLHGYSESVIGLLHVESKILHFYLIFEHIVYLFLM